MQSSVEVDFFTEYGDGSRYRIEEVIGKGSYGVVFPTIRNALSLMSDSSK